MDVVKRLIEDGMVQVGNRGFWFAKTPVTQALWCDVVPENPSKFIGLNRPVENVSWCACNEWIGKLNKVESVRSKCLRFRLPTLREWNDVAQDVSADYLSEDDFVAGRVLEEGEDDKVQDTDRRRILDCIGWCWENSCGETHDVALKMANRLGLYDLLGNVYEWCGDSPKDGICRYCLGGCWCSVAKELTGSSGYYEDVLPENTQSAMIGFRLVAEQK